MRGGPNEKVMEQSGEKKKIKWIVVREWAVKAWRWHGQAVYGVSETGGGRPKREGEQKWKEG